MENLIKQLSEDGIKIEIESCIYNRFRVSIHSKPLKSYYNYDISECRKWLIKKAIELYPESNFAKRQESVSPDLLDAGAFIKDSDDENGLVSVQLRIDKNTNKEEVFRALMESLERDTEIMKGVRVKRIHSKK